MTGSFLNELGPVPEPSTWVAMVALIITGGSMAVRRAVGRQRKFCEFGTPLGRDVPIFGG